jgi:hypothetical protein
MFLRNAGNYLKDHLESQARRPQSISQILIAVLKMLSHALTVISHTPVVGITI